jgi:hypothetical protein
MTLNPTLSEWLNLIFRWVHVFAGIMWVGTTYYFTWLDARLTEEEKAVANTNRGLQRGSPAGVCRKNGLSLRNLRALCASAVNLRAKTVHRRDAEGAEDAQSSFSDRLQQGCLAGCPWLLHFTPLA